MNITISTSCPTSFQSISISGQIAVKYYKFNQEGNLAYEYNPLHNMRVMTDTYVDSNGDTHQQGELVDFETDRLQFSLHHPVQIECQPSYDGSVNLILNDDVNNPRLINSRFSCLENNTYKIAERYKNNNTNIYRNIDPTFDIDTSLYKRITKIPKITFEGTFPGGNLKVGNYNFYFKLADVDGNETDFVAESGTVSCFIGTNNDPTSIRGGIMNESSNKMVKMLLSNIDTAYDYVHVYYTRSTSDVDEVPVKYAVRIDRDFVIKSESCELIISGFDNETTITIDEVNLQYFVASTAKTQCQCQNRLFLGNLSRPEIPYKELRDLALHFIPSVVRPNSIGCVKHDYTDATGLYEYYNPLNIYNYLGYWPGEIYRYGVVFILPDYTLSPVFNTRGINNLGEITPTTLSVTNANNERQYIDIDENNYLLKNGNTANLENVKGVVRFSPTMNPIGTDGTVTPIGIRFTLDDSDAIGYIKKYCKGFFFVRQKRIATTLAQALTIYQDQNCFLPCLKENPNGTLGEAFFESFIDTNRLITHDYDKRIIHTSNVKTSAALSPDAELKIPYFNNLFTGAAFTVHKASNQPASPLKTSVGNPRDYYIDSYTTSTDMQNISGIKVTEVEDSTKMLTSGTQKFSARGGYAEEAWRVAYASRDNIETSATNLVRGAFGTYIGLEGYNGYCHILNIMLPEYNESRMDKYFSIRYQSEEPFMPISDRIDSSEFYGLNCYRGDCYVGTFTHRMVRNFQDPEAPINDTIVDETTWKDNYQIDNKEDNLNVNRGDVNAVKIGHWATFKCLSNVNLCLRDVDKSNYNENGITGMARGFHPLYDMSWTGESKVPESSIYNSGHTDTLSSKYNYIMQNVPYLKNEFDNRILYSDIYVNDAFKNNYRVFKSTDFRDYMREFGSIVDMKSFNGNIVCTFEHGVCLMPVNERAVAANGAGGEAFINTNNVIPLNPRVLNSNYGSMWQESVIMTPNYVYGIDATAKKIWRTNGARFEVISDFKVQQFLNKFIALKEREKTPIIGVRNVKSHYNAYKQDVIFTFYNSLYGTQEQAWSLCFNELLNKWVTQYSWIPSWSANIDNVFFTFDRETSKVISRMGLNCTQYAASTIDNELSNDGIVLDNVLVPSGGGLVGNITLVNRVITKEIEAAGLSTSILTFTLLKNRFSPYFYITNNKLYANSNYPTTEPIFLNINCSIDETKVSVDDNIAQYLAGWKEYITINEGQFSNTIVVVPITYYNAKDSEDNYINLTTNFWKHGKAGIIDVQDTLKPCYWYGKQHPFEFEFVVNDKPGIHKIFENLYIISNRAAPESFHYQIVGDTYSFSKDKKNIYYRQEATKELYQNLGSKITFNTKYANISPSQNTLSTIFPWYYERIDTYDYLYDSYQQRISDYSKDYENLNGTEIFYNDSMNEFEVLSHSKGNDVNKVGRLRGNMQYKEDLWNVEIRPIEYMQKNETTWTIPPIVINNVPKDITSTVITGDNLPANYDITDISLPANGWTARKETRIRDKYIRIRVRYSGADKVVISALRTIYSISYA